MKESEDAGKTTSLQGRKQNNRTIINNQQSTSQCHAHASESTNNNQPAADAIWCSQQL